MTFTTSIRMLLCVAAMTLALASTADAALFRTFISNGGSDANANTTGCVVTAPCRTLATAYGVTDPAGEIVMMTPGGYGCVTITGPLTIIGTAGATSTATSGACIVITAGGTDKIYINTLQITGANVAGTIGIQVNSGQLTLIHSGLKLLATGIVVGNNSSTAHADIINTDIIGNTTGIVSNGAGVNTSVGNPPYVGTKTLVRISGGNIIDNTTELQMQNAAADTNQNCENTFWAYTNNGQPTVNMAGFTNFITWSPMNPPFSCQMPTYYSNPSSPAPN